MAGQRGFTYIGLLFAVAFLGLLLASAGEVWKTAMQREREEDLLFAGRQIQQGIASYHAVSQPGQRQWPRTLEELVEDNRGPEPRRHLRRIYRDPMLDSDRWGVVMLGDGIVGVFSRSPGTPRKKANFEASEALFEGARTYSDWRFMAEAVDPPARPR